MATQPQGTNDITPCPLTNDHIPHRAWDTPLVGVCPGVPATTATSNGHVHRPIANIAHDIVTTWGGRDKVYFGAWAYLEALMEYHVQAATDMVLTEQADGILLRLTVNWSTFRGKEGRAKVLKDEVKAILRAMGHNVR